MDTARLAGGRDSAPGIYFLGPVRSCLASLLHPQGPPLGRAGWWHTQHRDRRVWRRLEHQTEQLQRPSTSASPAGPYFNPQVGFSEHFCCCWQCCSTRAPCWDKSSWMDLHYLCFQAAPGMLYLPTAQASTFPAPDLAGQAELSTFWATDDGQGGCRQALAGAGITEWGSLFWSGSGMLHPKFGEKDCRQATCWIRNKINPIWSLPRVHHC